jgi:Streptomyces killer toxin-like.
MFDIKKAIRASAGAATLAALFAVNLPAAPAHAINSVPCNRHDYLKITGHYGNNPRRVQFCFANAGTVPLNLWVDQFSTGNNDIEYLDFNGQKIRIRRWTVINYPNRPPHVRSVTIL